MNRATQESGNPPSCREFVLYSRRGCHLCDDMLDALESLCRASGTAIRMVDVDSDDNLRNQYGTRVPVLEWAGRLVCEGRLDPQAVQKFIPS